MTPGTEITVRYRATGHARFELPAALCEQPARAQLAAALKPIPGIYRVDLYARQRKLSVRFLEDRCPFAAVTDALQALGGNGTPSSAAHSCCASASGVATENTTPLGQAAKQRTGTALSFRTRDPAARPGMLGPIKESTVVEFFNDVLVLFLIKLHWHMITQHWLREPWRYRYEWMAAIYLIYLLVRSRRPKT